MAQNPEESLNVKLAKNSLRYLHNLTEKIDGLIPALKCYYSTKRLTTEMKNKIVSSETSKEPIRCNHCCLRFADTLSHVYVKPEMKYRFQRKLMKKQRQEKPLTRFQELYMKKVKTLDSNTTEIMCSFCNHKTTVPTAKPSRNIINPVDNIHSEEELRASENSLLQKNKNGKVKKKKKNRDKFCGLQRNVVLAASSCDSHFNTLSNKKIRNMKISTPEVSVTLPTGTLNKTSKNIESNDNKSNGRKQKKYKSQTNLSSPKDINQQTAKQNNHASFLLSSQNDNSKMKNKKSQKYMRSKKEVAVTKPLSESLNISKSKKPTNKKKMKNKLNSLLNNTEKTKNGSSLKQFLKSL